MTNCPAARYVLTTGTGSGKSLAYIIPIVDSVLAAGVAGTGKCAAQLRLYPRDCFDLAPGSVFLGGEERLV
jgi:hypothetical protein